MQINELSVWIYKLIISSFVSISANASYGDLISVEGLDKNLYTAQHVHALVEVESCGKEEAKKGKYVGLLQLGPEYLKDARVTRAQAFTKMGAVVAWARVQRKYRVRRHGEPMIVIAIFHKGGPGTLKTWRKIVKKWKTKIEEAPTKAAKRALYLEAAELAARAHKIPNMRAFIERFESAYYGRAYWCRRKERLIWHGNSQT